MKILKIGIILEDNHADRLVFYTDLKDPVYPYTDGFTVNGQTAINTGEDFIKKNFPGIPYKIIRMSCARIIL